MFHEAISWIEARHSYKNALRAGRQQKMSQQQEREVRLKCNIAKIVITVAEGPYATFR